MIIVLHRQEYLNNFFLSIIYPPEPNIEFFENILDCIRFKGCTQSMVRGYFMRLKSCYCAFRMYILYNADISLYNICY